MTDGTPFLPPPSSLPYIQLLGHLLQVARRVAESEKLDEGYRIGKQNSVPKDC